MKDLKDAYFHVLYSYFHNTGSSSGLLSEVKSTRIVFFPILVLCSSVSSVTPGHLCFELHWRKFYLGSTVADGDLAWRSRPSPHEEIGVKAQCQVCFIHHGGSIQGLWRCHHLFWHINCLTMMAVFLPLKHSQTWGTIMCLSRQPTNTLVVFYINHQGGLQPYLLYKLAHQILRAVYIAGYLNQGVEILQGLRPGEWRLHPRWWGWYGDNLTLSQEVVNLFSSKRHTVSSGSH